MRKALFLLAPLALAACGHDDRPVIVNQPPAVVTPAPTITTPTPGTIVVTPKP